MLFRITLIAIILLCMLPDISQASDKDMTVVGGQEGVSISMDVRPGFNSLYYPSIPFPVEVEIHNGSQHPISGKIVIDAKTWIPPAEYTYHVFVSANRKKTFDMLMYNGASEDIKVTLFNDNDEILLERNIELHNNDLTRDAIILVLSEKNEDFEFLNRINFQELRQFNIARGFPYLPPFTQYNLRKIFLVRTAPRLLSGNIVAWGSLSAVYCDFRTYLNLDNEFKEHLTAWIRLGGELLLYPPSVELNEDEFKDLADDVFLPFDVTGYSRMARSGQKGYALIDTGNLMQAVNLETNHPVIFYKEPAFQDSLIATISYGTGGITVFKFPIDSILPENLQEWVEILFQLNLLSPPLFYSRIRSQFPSDVNDYAIRVSHIQTRSQRNREEFLKSMYDFAVTIVIPMTIIIYISLLFIRSRRKLVYIVYVLPFLIFLSLILPGTILSFKLPKYRFPGVRKYETYNHLDFIMPDFPVSLTSAYIIRKPSHEEGTLRIDSPDASSFYDEMVGGRFRMYPGIRVGVDPPGFFSSDEKTLQNLRVIFSFGGINGIGNIIGKVAINPDGEWEYEITINTAFHLSNCELYKYNQVPETPKMIPDIPQGKTIRGKMNPSDEVVSRDNQDIDNFVDQTVKGILQKNAQRELMYKLETTVSTLSYKPSRPVEAYSGEICFFAWTQDFNRPVRIGDSHSEGAQSTLVTARFDLDSITQESQVYERDISDLMLQQDKLKEAEEVLSNAVDRIQ